MSPHHTLTLHTLTLQPHQAHPFTYPDTLTLHTLTLQPQQAHPFTYPAHFDCYHNVLVQLVATKRVVLFAPDAPTLREGKPPTTLTNAAARGRHLHRLPRRLPDSCVTNLGTDEQVMNGKSTASVECQNFNVQICKNRFSLTRCHAQ